MPIERRRSRLRHALRRALMLALVALASVQAACEDQPCSVEEQKRSVVEIMRAVYFYNDDVDQARKYDTLDLGRYEDMFEVLEALRFDPPDATFSFITTPAAERLRLTDGIFYGFGVGLKQPTDDTLFLTRVYPDSPAEEALLGRGDEILAIDGRLLTDFADPAEIDWALGPSTPGVEVTFLIRPADPAEADREVTLVKRAVDLAPVGTPLVLDGGGTDVGYLPFFTFTSAADELLDAAMAAFPDGVTKLIVDLRYNRGGSLSVAAHAIDLLGSDGQATGDDGDVMFSVRYDVSDRDRWVPVRFKGRDAARFFDTVVFITSEESASASELMIKALEPYLDVYVVGATTFGKPVGQEAFDYCGGDFRLRPVTFDLVNALEDGEYYDGIPPYCPAEDDLTALLGDELEDSTATALTVATTGECPVAMASAARVDEGAVDSRDRLLPGAAPWLSVY